MKKYISKIPLIFCKLRFHKWEQWQDTPICKEYRFCTRCHKSQVRQIKHSWNNWQYMSKTNCQIIRTCNKCDETELGDFKHKWKNWTPNPNGTDIHHLRQTHKILKKRTVGEINTICFSLDIDYENLKRQIKSELIISLIGETVKTRRFTELLYQIQENVDDISKKDKELIYNITTDVSNPKVDNIYNLNWNSKHICRETRECSRCGESEERYNHNWGQPMYLHDNQCDWAHICISCGTSETIDKNHQWNNWQKDAKEPCSISRRTCKRCNIEERKRLLEKRHAWNNWSPDVEEPCSKKTRTCLQCGFEQHQILEKKNHDWSHWQEDPQKPCTVKIRTCKKCNKQEQSRLPNDKHEWKGWTPDPQKPCSKQVNQCSRCGEKKSKNISPNHEWKGWTKDPQRPCSRQVNQCNKCGERKYKNIYPNQHQWGEWYKQDPDSETFIKICNVCGEKQKAV